MFIDLRRKCTSILIVCLGIAQYMHRVRCHAETIDYEIAIHFKHVYNYYDVIEIIVIVI